jgi:hypothetical protein
MVCRVYLIYCTAMTCTCLSTRNCDSMGATTFAEGNFGFPRFGLVWFHFILCVFTSHSTYALRCVGAPLESVTWQAGRTLPAERVVNARAQAALLASAVVHLAAVPACGLVNAAIQEARHCVMSHIIGQEQPAISTFQAELHKAHLHALRVTAQNIAVHGRRRSN